MPTAGIVNENLTVALQLICCELGLNINLRDFQIAFFEHALTGVSGFLRVCFCKFS